MLEEFVGEIPYNLLLILNINFWILKEMITGSLKEIPTAKYLLEFLPSDIILSQIFNGKLKIGNLSFSISKPSIIIAPFYVMKTLKEWDLIVHSQKIGSEGIVVTNTRDICEESEIAVREYDISSKLFEKKYISTCGKDKYEKLRLFKAKMNEVLKREVAVVYRNEVKDNFLDLEISVDFYIILFKNPSKEEVEAYEKLRSVIKL
ncbi:hypothetical protein DMP16_04400 [Sulfolobus sp. B1]|nr:hypothetical protein DJ532_06280 [Sulfolobus sp. A20-N-F8]TRM79564.1 hypothetical protein DJ528_00610 [Sulfolobus sp. B5]TRM81990.1 hypothetical protein DJ524_02245 [Sulfolobus sp. D5]TRM87743.1 hypothetical protein DJ521_03090 [Sulfolobus sp. E3]TRM88413.1 hypothetical protein DJ529_05525 [Sulfolobus sp. C3]TRM93066.1 hypothetical protein DJ526_04710 [Sulfolobus sp. A20-N-G8]TRM96980.1 hypothetical protein DMP16_04400 [Sulfolobus sp. B1]TRM99253.1 hypothetical protein DJ527_08975 [Sulfol